MLPDVVCNAGPLIHLAAIGRFGMLRDLFAIVHVSGTIGVLLAARRLGLIAELKPDLDRLVAFGFHLERDLYLRLCSVKGNEEG